MTTTPTIVIGFSGAATIREADDIAQQLKQALETSDRIEIDCSGISELDITFIQLMLAARKTAATAGKSLTLCSPAEGALRHALTLSGFMTESASSFWNGERTIQ